MYIGGLDIGTSGCKIAVYDAAAVCMKLTRQKFLIV